MRDVDDLKHTIRYDTIAEFNVDSKAEYSALSSTRSQKKKLKQTTHLPLNNAFAVFDWRVGQQSVIDDTIDQWRSRLRARVRANGGYFQQSL